MYHRYGEKKKEGEGRAGERRGEEGKREGEGKGKKGEERRAEFLGHSTRSL